jgi:hypothetical protein
VKGRKSQTVDVERAFDLWRALASKQFRLRRAHFPTAAAVVAWKLDR